VSGDETYNIKDVRAENLAIGHQAIAQYNVGSPKQQEELQELIALLRRQLDEHGNELEDPEALRESTDVVERELQTEKPNLRAVKTMLSGMLAGAERVASVVQTVTTLRLAVEALI
jgi:hypothetical protein